MELLATSLCQYILEVRPDIEKGLLLYLPAPPLAAESKFDEALRYALFPGGKRLRPVLTMLAAELIGGGSECVMEVAAAVEYLHNSSLIFDDLPCMDDAKDRRGKPALHVRYGEGLAILVGLALLNSAYGLMISTNRSSAKVSTLAHEEMVKCVEAQIGGQAYDIARFADPALGANPPGFDKLRNLKTTTLIKLALRLGAIQAGGEERQLSVLSEFADLLGNAYQISDDIADQVEDERHPRGRRLETSLEAPTTERERDRLLSLVKGAKNVIRSGFGDVRHVDLLCDVADFLVDRIA